MCPINLDYPNNAVEGGIENGESVLIARGNPTKLKL